MTLEATVRRKEIVDKYRCKSKWEFGLYLNNATTLGGTVM